MYLLDTNVMSEMRQNKPNQSPQVRRWAAAQPSARLFLSAITILELEQGVQALQRRTPPQGAALRRWLDGVRKAFEGRILAFGESAAVLCAAAHVQRPRAERDAMIGAIGLEHGFAVVTRNVSDFQDMGVQLLNPWEFS